MYVGRDFHPSDVGEDEVYSFDFVNDVASGEIIEHSNWYCTVAADSEATDGSPQDHISLDPTNNGTVTSQRVAGLISGVKYVLQAVIMTSEGNTKSLWSHVLTRTPA